MLVNFEVIFLKVLSVGENFALFDEILFSFMF